MIQKQALYCPLMCIINVNYIYKRNVNNPSKSITYQNNLISIYGQTVSNKRGYSVSIDS